MQFCYFQEKKYHPACVHCQMENLYRGKIKWKTAAGSWEHSSGPFFTVLAVHCQDRRTNSCLALPLCFHPCISSSCSPGLPSVVSVLWQEPHALGAAGLMDHFFLLEAEVAESQCFNLVWVFTLQLLAAIVPLRRITLQSYPCSRAYHKLQLVATEGRV